MPLTKEEIGQIAEASADEITRRLSPRSTPIASSLSTGASEFTPEIQAVIDKWRKMISEGGELIEADARREIIRAGGYKLGVGETDRAMRAIKRVSGSEMKMPEIERYHGMIVAIGGIKTKTPMLPDWDISYVIYPPGQMEKYRDAMIRAHVRIVRVTDERIYFEQ